jgi:hypothetical protein
MFHFIALNIHFVLKCFKENQWSVMILLRIMPSYVLWKWILKFRLFLR